MNDDELDRLLREQGARWRDEQPPPPGVDVDRLAERPRRRWVAPVGAAAAVAAVVGGVVLAVGHDDDRRGEEPAPIDSATVHEDFVVPWAEIGPRRPTWPAPAQIWTPEPSYADGVETCRADQLDVAVGGGDGAEGAGMQILRFTARPDERCALPTDLQVGFRAQGEPLELDVEEAPSGGGLPAWPGKRVLLAGESAAVMGLFPSPEWCRASAGGIEAVLTWPGGETAVPLDRRCEEEDALPDAPVTVVPLQPEGAVAEQPGAALSPLDVRQVSHTPGEGDEDDTFVVELLATHGDLSLDVCPDAHVSVQYSRDDFHELPYGLNCDDVPYVDDEGMPYLPKDVPVRFAVEVPMPEPPAEAVVWTLRSPMPQKLELEVELTRAEQTESTSAATTLPPPDDGPRIVATEDAASFLLDVSNQSVRVIDAKVYVDQELTVTVRS